jgi:ATP adenylyltransferase
MVLSRARVDLSSAQFYNVPMEHLWAPWRIRYILGEKESGCFFCRKSQEADDAKNHVVIRERNCFALLNTYPYNAGHLMVAPYKHTGELDDLSEQELSDLMALTRRCKQLLAKTMKPEGFNIGLNLGRCAGAGVLDHVHMHIVPRWNADTNFMPVLADTHVVPQALDELYQMLMKHVER